MPCHGFLYWFLYMEHVRPGLETYVVLMAVFAGAFTAFVLYHAGVMHKPVLAHSIVKCLNASECDLLTHMMGKTVGAMVDAVMLVLLLLVLATATVMFIFNRRRQKQHTPRLNR